MKTTELKTYIEVRHGELCMDEILYIIDINRNPQIDHIVYENGLWQMWDNKGNYMTFKLRG